MRVFCVCPANMATGGTEVIHQFCQCLSQEGIENYIVYTDSTKTQCPTPESFLKYRVKYVSQYIDAPDSVLVLPETRAIYSNWCQKGIVMIWWLSVDFYKESYECMKKNSDWDIFGFKHRNNVLHFVQSQYAKEFLKNEMGLLEYYFLKDYINDEIVQVASELNGKTERKNICLYNPRKGYEFIKPIIEKSDKTVDWVALQGFSPRQMAEVMCQAKVYVDFGMHPGKDRIPREAAVCGCCVITNQEGSAAYNEDVMIPQEYKVEDVSNIRCVLEKIYDLINHYEIRTKEYEGYRQAIGREKTEFIMEIKQAIIVLQMKTKERMMTQPFTTKTDYSASYGNLANATTGMEQLICKSMECWQKKDISQAVGNLLMADYVLQLMRESIYLQMIDMVNVENAECEVFNQG